MHRIPRSVGDAGATNSCTPYVIVQRDGRDGLPGRDGIAGRDGLPGSPGVVGEKGERGPPGLQGKKSSSHSNFFYMYTPSKIRLSEPKSTSGFFYASNCKLSK